MAEKNSSSPFTNTRLMAAGIIVGLVGALLAFYTMNKRIRQATGGTVKVYYLKKELSREDGLTPAYYDSVLMPKLYTEKATKLITGDGINRFLGYKPYRDMEVGEPLSVHDFSLMETSTDVPAPRPGFMQRTIPVSNDSDPGKTLTVGKLVNVTGKVIIGGDRTKTETLLLLQRVRVQAINGDIKAVDNVDNVTLEITDKANRLLTDIEVKNDYILTIAPREALPAPPGEQVPQDTLIKLGLN